MANNNLTTFQKINNVLFGSSVPRDVVTTPGSQYRNSNEVLFSTTNKDEYEKKLQQYRQQKLLSYQWVKAGNDIAQENISNLTAVKLMYRDADLMDGPEIGAAMQIICDEACSFDSEKRMVSVKSKSKRVKAILEDLLQNRLNIHIMLPMVCRSMIKYGNEFMLLNIDKTNGIRGWKELPVYEIDRIENGYGSYASGIIGSNDVKEDYTKFVWAGHNDSNLYQNWQVAHFRLLNDSFFLPYGTSALHTARRAWRMWSMMEDSMLIYRLDKSVERRVYKIYVGAIDDADVPGFVEDVANEFKRTPIYDPETGQIDLRRNFLDATQDYFIPVRNENAANPIDVLQSAQNQTSMEDIEYMQNKIFCALRVPKTFLNFQEAQGKGQNLAIMDIRFARMVNRVQQFLLMELNKICMVHLFLLGLQDELSNFELSMNNPSSQMEALELDEWTKRAQLVSTVMSDPGIGMPLVSLHFALRKFMKLSDEEIKDILCEIRLEKAMAAELENTANIIKKTGVFDSVDRIYGDYDAMNNPQPVQQQEGGEDGGIGGGGGAIGGFGEGLGDLGDLGEPGADESGEIGGEDMEMDMGEAPEADNGGQLMERRNKAKTFTEIYLNSINSKKKKDNLLIEEIDFEGKDFYINEQINGILDDIDKIIG